MCGVIATGEESGVKESGASTSFWLKKEKVGEQADRLGKELDLSGSGCGWGIEHCGLWIGDIDDWLPKSNRRC